MSRRKVVDVPRDKMPSPSVDSEAIVAGLSPVNGATEHSVRKKGRYDQFDRRTSKIS